MPVYVSLTWDKAQDFMAAGAALRPMTAEWPELDYVFAATQAPATRQNGPYTITFVAYVPTQAERNAAWGTP